MIVTSLKKQMGNKDVLQDVSFVLSDHDKVGLVGSNGVGKSTLLKVLASEITKDSGDIKLNGETIAYLQQEIPYVYNELSIIEYIKNQIGIDELEKRLHELENNLTDDNMNEYSDVLNLFLALDGYSFEDNLNNILLGLHLNEDLSNKIGTLSGGEKINVLLATLLMKNSDIILLDEPTNNLDLQAIEWLEKHLIASEKKMMIVSHDETFLNNITNKIFELENGKINVYNLSYKQYLEQKELEYEQLKSQHLKAQEEKDKLKKQVQKAKEWANKGVTKKAHNDHDKIANNFAKERTNSGNISKLNKALQNIEVPMFEEKEPIKVFFHINDARGNKDIYLEHLVCGYDTFKTPELDLLIPFGTKLNVIGGNGTGKTTLIKTILGENAPVKGSVKIGNDVKMGYISQNTLDGETNDSIYSYLTKDKEEVDTSQAFLLLSKFHIDYHDRDKLYQSLSPGERTRVNLAKLALDHINVLILDEVTNHLDKEALDLIYELVSDYEGTIISISHNRKYNQKLNANIDLDVETGKVLQKIPIQHVK